MTILIFDTETTGFPRANIPLSDPSQPHIVQLAAELCEDDGAPIQGMNLIVNNGVEIPKEAADIHGITTEKAKQFGISPIMAMHLFRHMMMRSDLMIAHNLKFDIQMTAIAWLRAFPNEKIDPVAKYCTMEKATRVINLPPSARMRAAGFNGPKAPRLEECIKHFFDEDLTGAHDAMIDVHACKRVYFHLKALESAKAG